MTRPRSGGRRGQAKVTRDSRGVVPSVGKTLELGLGVLVVALVTTTMFGSVVPQYRTIGGAEVGDRALARAGSTVETAIPPRSAAASVSRSASLPATIRGATYEIRTDGHALVLHHPHPGIGGRLPLPFGARNASLSGAWRSTDRFQVTVTANRTAVDVSIGGAS